MTDVYAGQPILAAHNADLEARIDALEADWTTYAGITWTCQGTAPSLGNGTLAGRYLLRPHSVVYQGSLVAGSTTTFGTGTFRMSLPVAASAEAVSFESTGTCQILDDGVFRRPGVCLVATTTYITFLANTSPGDVGATLPQTFAQNDRISWDIEYSI